MRHRIVYFETSRGCPYQCQYCLSSLERGVRYFPTAYTLENLGYLVSGPARQIKFLDRTFNLKEGHARTVFDFLIRNYRPGLSCQFEVYADLLPDDMIDSLNERLPRDFFRFEIGIQSTYEPTNEAVRRRQDFPLLRGKIGRIMAGGKIDLHLDLIAGLPHESLERFARSFDDVFELGAKEVQLGFLKMLRGTALRADAARYGYRYDAEAPYQIRCNDALSEADLERIRQAEHALDKFWNSGRFPRTMQHLCSEEYKGRYFELFDRIGQFFLLRQYPRHGYQLEDLFRYLQAFLTSEGIELFDLLRADYYGNFTRRPSGFWEKNMDKKQRKRLLNRIGQDDVFLARHNLTRAMIEKQTAIDPADDRVMLTVFREEETGNSHFSIYYPDI